MEGGKGRVCVTGGTGFIGSWMIKKLLEDGYSVNTTVRSSSNPEHKKDVSFLTNLAGASQKLEIMKADLRNSESFKEAIEGCIGVFHVATPVDFEEREAEEVVTKRSIEGALGILKACLASKTVKRVVYTSSASAVTLNGKEEQVMDESFWSDEEYIRTSKQFGWSYAISKTLTEKAVLEFGDKNGLQVVTVIPPLVLGPFVCPKLPGSVRSSLSLVFGEKERFGYIHETPMVHVDDVARAHIFLLEHPNPKGRYNCSACLATIENMFEIVSARYPQFQLPSLDSVKEVKGLKFPDLSSKKLIDAGFEFEYGLEQTFVDAIECCKQKAGKGRVCVTGGTGFIGSWIIKRLLDNGYSVNATVRSNPEHKKDVSFLTNFGGASQKLQIMKADLNKPESFKEAIEGCIGVFHVATTVDFEERESEEVLTRRSIDGALGILKACLTCKTVKRVVYTSSASAVFSSSKEEQVMDESFWSDVEYLRTSKPLGWSYAISKTLTEKAVLEFGDQNGLDVVTLTPPIVFGPFICPQLPPSVRAALYLPFGDKDRFAYLLQTPMVHVDDVARAHIFLLQHPNPKGRYNCAACLATIENMFEIVSARYPQFQLPSLDSLKEIKGPKFPHLSSKKLIDSGFKFECGLEEMLVDAIECCKEKGYL
ncbi:bifunctional dihydroflavonol 4-reductase/flavanone 4-reductase [Senna tora]|uniref:Bifunctional dihydroflavonol 4-reductase/flavanone 4-reductase n=1 Tax=Senna tora TaxID=362788 RepID=A0A834TNT1_9FABA|nr:bifunctional dihydroflavonol 4-reductase/flavanone 4-reductase [Senna tora]